MYPLRTCHLLLTPEAIARGKYNVCLEYHIGNCKGACKNLQSEAEYLDDILQATSIIKGEIREVLALLTRRMKAAAKQLNFEEAEILKKHLVKLENYKSKSVIVNPLVNNIDVFSLLVDDAMAYVNFMRVVHGAITQVHTIEMRLIIDEEPATLIGLAIAEMQQRMEGLSPEVIVSVMPDVKLDKIKYTLPKAGDKFHLLQLSERNAKAYRVERLKYIERTDPERHTERIMNCMKKDLHLTEPPCRIECFDNSNIQGSNPVASCVVFINGRPAKKEYRCFNVKTVEGPNDFASMEEIVYRRYRRVLAENLPLPQLIVIDGGKGQVKAAMKSIRRLKIEEQVAVLGLAKRLEEIYFPDDSVPLLLNKNSETMKILMNIRDEAHRFGITFHRNKRSADFLSSELRNIKGVGDVSFNRLMTEFKTVAAVKKATEEELANVAGKRIAKLIRGYFDANDEQ
jgi:excinuclease ABC subunit C